MFPVEALFLATAAIMELMNELKNKGTIGETLTKYGALGYRDFFSFMGLRQYIEFDERFMLRTA